MVTKIVAGFPLRRCSWAYEPIVSVALTDRMVRWLDSVCLKQVAFNFKGGLDCGRRRQRVLGETIGT